jgi:ABC-type antimicrobial peptide transport system permease subunit
MTVVGVIADFRQEPVPGREALPAAYVPFPYHAMFTTGLTIRARGDVAAMTNAARDAIRQSDPTIALGFIRAMDTLRQLGYWPYKIFGWVFSLMGAVALCLAVVGVYGVLAYSIAQRTQEIGVRVALGASGGDVLRLVLFQGLRLAGGGIVVGVAGALAVTRIIRSVLYNVAPSDPFTFVTIVIALVAVALITSYVPARQATTVDPLVALRTE